MVAVIHATLDISGPGRVEVILYWPQAFAPKLSSCRLENASTVILAVKDLGCS